MVTDTSIDDKFGSIPLPGNHLSPSTLTFKLTHEVPRQDYEILTAMLNGPRGSHGFGLPWGWLIEATPDIIGRRFSSGQPFIVAYDTKRADDYIPGVDITHHEQIPVVFLETALIKTEGNLHNIPLTYWNLTNRGLWQPAPKDPDTALCVDLTNIPSRRGNGSHEVGMTIGFAKKLFRGETDYNMPDIPHIATYSPDIPGVIRMHTDFGAKDTGYVINHARLPLGALKTEEGKKVGRVSFSPDALQEFTSEMQKLNPLFKPGMYHTHITVYKGFGLNGYNVLNNGPPLR